MTPKGVSHIFYPRNQSWNQGLAYACVSKKRGLNDPPGGSPGSYLLVTSTLMIQFFGPALLMVNTLLAFSGKVRDGEELLRRADYVLFGLMGNRVKTADALRTRILNDVM